MGKKIIINETQEKILLNSLLSEYYETIRNPLLKNNIICVYKNDREGYTPHIHIRHNNGEIEIEVSLLDFNIINVKRPNNGICDWGGYNDIKKPFFKWLNKTKNIFSLFELWDGNNEMNTLYDFVKKHNINCSTILNEYFKINGYG